MNRSRTGVGPNQTGLDFRVECRASGPALEDLSGKLEVFGTEHEGIHVDTPIIDDGNRTTKVSLVSDIKLGGQAEIFDGIPKGRNL